MEEICRERVAPQLLLLLDHLQAIFPIFILFSCIFSQNQSTCVLLIFSFTYSLEGILTDCRDLRGFYVNLLFGFSNSYFVIICTTIKFPAQREKIGLLGISKESVFSKLI